MSQFESHVRFRSSLLSITDVSCRPSTCRQSNEEHTTVHQVVLPRAGVFVKHSGRQQAVADPIQVLFFNANEPYRVSHPVPGGDECTVFVFSTETLMQAIGLYDPMVRDRPEKPFHHTHGSIELQTILRQQRFRQQLSDPSQRTLEIEELALDLLEALFKDLYQNRHRGQPGQHRLDTLRLQRERAESVKLLIAERPGLNLSLAEIASRVHCAPFYLARTFRAFVGLPIHQYQLRLRLALALERLGDYPRDLTNLALDLGFSSHSHFTSTFQRSFGTSPSAFRRPPPRSRSRENKQDSGSLNRAM
jgi:AraC-like DNA-binding protein